MECIIYKGQNVDGTINWGSVIPTVLLFMFCGPCMFVYRLINRCTNGKEVSNVGKSNTNASAVSPPPPLQSPTVSQKNNSQISKSQRQVISQ